MCSPVRFCYRCGCTEDANFECAAAAAACPSRRERDDGEHPATMTTWLDEYCHDCSILIAIMVAAISRAAHPGSNSSREDNIKDDSDSELECRALRERDVNLPSKLPPTTTLSSEP